ncbi:MAG: fibrobacter succinogenes major paralogous domain-containing protein [Fibromonadaceae bacterium]|jgi:uncharacterized protein (TIGR02145 family)|nr:fibrobacter succinogenes major paralogous domain-containing protein [Fibromonadaceae bacterium]
MNKIHSNGKRFFAPTIAAGLALAMAFTLNACGGDGGGGDEAPSSSSSGSLSSSSSGGGSQSSSSQPSHEHAWGDWSVTTAPTCEAGMETRTCAGDNSHKETRSIAKLFDWEEWTVKTPATPTTVGVETRSCPNNASPAQTRPLYPKCGSVEYNPDKYECRNGSKIYLKSGLEDSRDGNTYDAVLIGTQVWMAENLNFNADGSRCYGDNTGGDSEGNCAEYGRLYDWATAMGGAPSSVANPSGVQGVCPSGWHLPSNAEWDRLYRYADGTSGTDSPYSGPTAGKYLKATSGWNSGGNGTDDFGFSALPGGFRDSGGNFIHIGNDGLWWSSSEYNSSDAYYRGMYSGGEDAYYSSNINSFLRSVRCVQD